MNIHDKIAHVSDAMNDQKVLNDLRNSLNLEKHFFIKFNEMFGLVQIIVSHVSDTLVIDADLITSEDLASYKVEKEYVFAVSLDDKDLSMQEVYVETTDDILTDEELMKFLQAIATIESALK